MTTRHRTTTLCRPQGTSRTMTLFITPEDFNTMREYAEAAADIPITVGVQQRPGNLEVCGYAFVRRFNPTTFQVIPGSVFITTQTVGPGFSMPDPAGEGEVSDRDDEFEPDEPVFRLLWHSHVNGTAQFSVTDLNTHDDMATMTACDAMFFLVLNTNGDATANFEQYQPNRIGAQIALVVSEDRDDTSYRTRMAEFADKRTLVKPQQQQVTRGTVLELGSY